jgi:hypothetical protein
MARPLPLIVHERQANWARQLRPRVAPWPVRLAETRTAADLVGALRGSASALVVADLRRVPARVLDDLGQGLAASPDALALVLDPDRLPGVPALARELGATHVLSGVATPPAVVELLARWLPLARRRLDARGWTADPEPPPQPWDLGPILGRA